jgi:hypothetical protein
LITSPAPVSVPPVPQPLTKKSSRLPAKSLRISGPGRAAVVGRVREVLELPREEPAVFLGELGSLPDHARAALGGRRQDHLGAQRAHDLAALDRERLDHHGDERIALGRADHRERDAGVARGRLDDRLAGLEGAALFRILDDRDREAILDRGHRVEELALDVHRHVLGCEAVDAHDGRAADRAQDAVVDHGPTVRRRALRACCEAAWPDNRWL